MPVLNAPLTDPFISEDTIITLADWYHYVSLQAPAIPRSNSTLINGKGRYPGGPSVPLAVVNVVRKNGHYRLRLVSISCDPFFTFSIDGHQLTIIEVDGENTQPLVVDSLQIFAGQRYSVVLNANQPIDNYWIRAVPNVGASQDFTGLTNLAILRYLGAPPVDPSDPTTNIPSSILPLKETDLHPLVPNPVPGNPVPGGADININLNVSLDPKIPVLLQILSGVPPSQLLPNGSIYIVEGNKSVEVSIPAGAPGAPRGNSTYNFDNPVVRDVVSMGNDGDNVTIRFFTDNPGPWFLHCHIRLALGEVSLVRPPFRMLMYSGFSRGFAVVFAEDVPNVSTTDHPPREFERISIIVLAKNSPKQPFLPEQWDELCPKYNDFVTA
ncbi:laccase 3 [Lactarius deliciosus]|nr:laccase 3 [Lactarius deliciosus]